MTAVRSFLGHLLILAGVSVMTADQQDEFYGTVARIWCPEPHRLPAPPLPHAKGTPTTPPG